MLNDALLHAVLFGELMSELNDLVEDLFIRVDTGTGGTLHLNLFGGSI